MTARKGLTDSLDNPENVQQLNGLVEDVRYALMDYQVCTSNRPALVILNIHLRLRYNKTSTKRAVKKL